MMFSDQYQINSEDANCKGSFANNEKRILIFQTAATVAWCFVQTAGKDDEKREGTRTEVEI